MLNIAVFFFHNFRSRRKFCSFRLWVWPGNCVKLFRDKKIKKLIESDQRANMNRQTRNPLPGRANWISLRARLFLPRSIPWDLFTGVVCLQRLRDWARAKDKCGLDVIDVSTWCDLCFMEMFLHITCKADMCPRDVIFCCTAPTAPQPWFVLICSRQWQHGESHSCNSSRLLETRFWFFRPSRWVSSIFVSRGLSLVVFWGGTTLL